MIRIEGGRGSGKTTRLLYLAKEQGQTFVISSAGHIKYVEDMAVKYFGKDHGIKIITVYELFSPYFRPEKGEKFLIDDLDSLLENRHVVGYSMTCGTKENL